MTPITVPLPPYVVRSAVEEAVQSGKATAFVSDETWSARALLMDVYYSQTLCWQVETAPATVSLLL